MIEYEELRADIDRYLMERFKHRKSLVWLTVNNIIVTRRNSRVDLYLRIRRSESRFPPDCLIIARLGFSKKRIGHGSHFVRFLSEIALKYGFKHIGLESTNEKGASLIWKLGFYSIDGSNYVVSAESIISYFSEN